MSKAARMGIGTTCVCALTLAATSLLHAAALPSPWISQDVGVVGIAGSASLTGGVFAVQGAGADIWGSMDGFHAVMQPIAGDVQIVARVASIQSANTFAKAGLMLRGSMTAGAPHVVLDVRPNGSIEFMTRSATGGSTAFVAGTTQAAPVWLKLTRSGAVVSGFVSTNGTSWSQVGAVALSAPASAYAGLVVTSHSLTDLNTSTFDNVAISGGGTLAAPWQNVDIGAVGVAGGGSTAGGTFTIKGAGADVWGAVDAFHAVEQTLAGDVQLIARVVSLQNTNTFAKAGLMLRDSTAANAAHVILDLRPSGDIEFMTRPAAGGETSWLSGATHAAPVWLKLTRVGTLVTGYVSADGASWTIVGSTTVSFGAAPVAALVVTSHDVTQLNTALFDNVSTGPLAAPPAAPASPSPSAGATGVSSSPLGLSWTSSGATSYDVKFGTTNPPPSSASGLSTPAYTPSALQTGTTYYWQVVAKNSGGATAGPVWSFTTKVPPPAAPALPSPPSSATGIAATTVALSWTAAGATSYDVSFGTTNPPAPATQGLAIAPYLVSSLQGGTTYYWQIVARNSGGATAGPVWSFTTAVPPPSAPASPSPSAGAAGVPTRSITLSWTSTGATSYDVNVGTMNPPPATAAGIAAPSYTASNLQPAATYYWQVIARNASGATAGPVWSFATAASQASSSVPSQYAAITDRIARSKPALPPLGSSGYTFNDPTFGSKILRVTDGQTRPGLVNRSFRVPSNAHTAAWNATATAFIVISNDGTIIPYKFDPLTMSAARYPSAPDENGGLTLRFYTEPQFSLVNPDVIYGGGGSNSRTILAYDFSTGAYSTVVDLDTIVGGLANTYVGTVTTGGVPDEKLLTFFGGGGQDAHYYALLRPLAGSGGSKLLNTVASTINGAATGTALNFHIHAMQIDKSGRYVFIYPSGADLGAPRFAAQVYLWDTATDAITPLTQDMHPAGHDAAGFGVWINQDCCTSSSWDAAQWQFRSLAAPAQTSDLIAPALTPQEIYMADHTTWNNAQPDRLVPVVSSTYRYGNNAAPWRAWDDEIVAIDTTSGGGGTVWRFAHHRSNIASDSNPAQPYFWYEPIANISPDGRWVLFTSNWEKTLGTDSSEGTARQDVFLVQLTPVP